MWYIIQDNIESKKKLFAKIIIIVAILIIGSITYIKNKIDENSYNKMYENLQIESIAENIDEKVIDEAKEYKIKVYVTGAVNFPGVIELEEGARIQDAINLAGGAKEDANLEKVNLAYCLEDGQKLYIPNIGENEVEYISTENGDNVIEKNSNSNNSKVNINTGGVEELKALPGVGDLLAQKIIDYREKNGKFKTIDDLKNVSGIGDKKFESMKEYVSVK